MIEGTRNILSFGAAILAPLFVGTVAADNYVEARDGLSKLLQENVIDDKGFAEFLATSSTTVAAVVLTILSSWIAGRGSYRLMGGREY